MPPSNVEVLLEAWERAAKQFAAASQTLAGLALELRREIVEQLAQSGTLGEEPGSTKQQMSARSRGAKLPVAKAEPVPSHKTIVKVVRELAQYHGVFENRYDKKPPLSTKKLANAAELERVTVYRTLRYLFGGKARVGYTTACEKGTARSLITDAVRKYRVLPID